MNLLYQKNTKCVIAAFATALLAACGGGSGGTGEADSPQALAAISNNLFQFPDNAIKRLGIFGLFIHDAQDLIDLGLTSGFVNASAEFTNFEQVPSKAYLTSQFLFEVSDTCSITIASSDGSEDVGIERNVEFEEITSNSTLISAGETLSISTPTGSWPDLISSESTLNNSPSVYYHTPSGFSTLGELPQGSTLSIPGDEFPAFNSVSIPHVERLTDVELLNISEGRITAESQIFWRRQNNSTSSSFAEISLRAKFEGANPNIELDISLICVVSDDGEFRFPDNAKALLSNYSFTKNDMSLTRFGVESAVQGDALVLILNSSILDF